MSCGTSSGRTRCIRRRQSTAPLKLRAPDLARTGATRYPSTTVDGPIEASRSSPHSPLVPTSIRRRQSTAPLKRLGRRLVDAAHGGIRRRQSTAPLKPRSRRVRDPARRRIRRRQSTAPLKLEPETCWSIQPSTYPSTTVDGPIEALSSSAAGWTAPRCIRRRQSTAPLVRLA